jgi:methylenetetrahydrofolate--tRNA-(uracil-5-)-methyltransferase
MNINFGLFPDIDARDAKGRPIKGRERKKAVAERARADFGAWLGAKLAAE